MRSKEIERYKESLSLTQRQKEILTGSLIGDGHLESHYRPDVARLKVEHSYKQKEYVDWFYQEFEDWTRKEPYKKTREAWGKVYEKYCFCTLSHSELAEFRKDFYEESKKIIPQRILEKHLDNLGLAVWYMDDGSIKSKRHKGVFLNTQSFNEEDIRKLQKILRKKFKIDSTTRKDSGGKQIYLGSESGEKLIEQIEEFLLPCLKHKIPKPLKD